jgi:hypothetical protein
MGLIIGIYVSDRVKASKRLDTNTSTRKTKLVVVKPPPQVAPRFLTPRVFDAPPVVDPERASATSSNAASATVRSSSTPPGRARERRAYGAPRSRASVGVSLGDGDGGGGVAHVPVAPLWWDNDEGAYMLSLQMGKGRVEVVLDTGSSQISAKGSSCRWTNCGESNQDACVTKACPCGNTMTRNEVGELTPSPRSDRECQDFYYHPGGEFVEPGEKGAGSSTTLVYGSQEDTVSHYLDSVSLPCSSLRELSCELLHRFAANDSSKAPPHPTDQHTTNEYLLGEMIVHLVNDIRGTSTSNLLGLARPSLGGGTARQGASTGDHVVVEKLLPEVQKRGTPAATLERATTGKKGGRSETHGWRGALSQGHDDDDSGDGQGTVAETARPAEQTWSIVMLKHGGWFALGSLDACFPNVQYAPLIDPPSFTTFVTHFYILRIVSLEVGPRLDALVKVKKHAPKFCLLDTGTTYTYGNVELGASLAKLGYEELGWSMRLTLGDKKKSPIVLTYEPRDLVDADYPSTSVFQCTEGKTLPDFSTLFPEPDVLLFGALMMQNRYWEFDLGRGRVGVQSVTP